MTEQAIDQSDTSLLWCHSKDSESVYDLKQAVEICVRDYIDNDQKPPEVVEMYAFKHKTMSEDWFAEDAIENLIMRLDEEYGDPEDGATEATQEMKDAALAFVQAVTAGYKVWQAELVGRVEITVSDYWSAS